MEKAAANLKLAFLVALLVIGSCLPRGIEAQDKPVQCEKPSDCVDICHGCTVDQCTAGLCVCGCAFPAQENVGQCMTPDDCVPFCGGCPTNLCEVGSCVCGCKV